jgi:signal transduction histidine kinase
VRSKNVEVELQLDETLPRAIQADESRLRQVLLSLLINAIKYTTEGKIKISAQLQNKPGHPDNIIISVSDTGCGITPDLRSRIFEPFEQADSTTTQVNGGAGLGLAISKNLVELMHGEIGVDSQPGEGSTFWFSIPVEVVGESDE